MSPRLTFQECHRTTTGGQLSDLRVCCRRFSATPLPRASRAPLNFLTPLGLPMNSMPLSHAICVGVSELNSRGTRFRPSTSSLIMDFTMSSGSSGVIALAPENGQRGNRQGYDLLKLSAPEVPQLDIAVNDIWTCAKEHYGLSAATAVAGAGGVPISKLRLGHKVYPDASRYTNLVSHVGLKFFPMATLPHGSTAARVAKSTFGTIRVFGIVGRALPFVAVGLAVFDAISIGICAYEAKNGN